MQLLLIAAAAITALVLLVSGYMFLIVSVIFGIAHAAGISLGVDRAHDGACCISSWRGGCGFFAARQVRKPMFTQAWRN